MKQFIDLHCHPAMKALGHSFKNISNPGVHTKNAAHKGSIWYYQPPTGLTKLLNRLLNLTKFRQADFTSYMLGGGSICVATLYPLEKQFVRNQYSTSGFRKLASNLATGLSKERVEYVQQLDSYFVDLIDEYNFYLQQNGQLFTIKGKKCRYFMVDTYSQIEQHRAANEGTDIYTIYVFIAIEGVHVFDPAVIDPTKKNAWAYDKERVTQIIPQVKKNIDIIMGKANIPSGLAHQPTPDKVLFRPKFITFAHHFSNHLCGHAESLAAPVNKLANQRPQLNSPFLHKGEEVLKYLIDHSVIIDIKHMSAWARQEYFELMAKDYPNKTSLVSHGAANGKISFRNPSARDKDFTGKLKSADINFYDEEIVYLANKKGIFGIQMDERRVASEEEVKESNNAKGGRNNKKLAKAKLLWNQIRYIGELLDENDLNAWDLQAIGSDHDGVVDPINMFWGSENIPDLQTYLVRHAEQYMNGPGTNLKTKNQLSGLEIIEKFMFKNADAFMKAHF